jgi:hypothetical protein
MSAFYFRKYTFYVALYHTNKQNSFFHQYLVVLLVLCKDYTTLLESGYKKKAIKPITHSPYLNHFPAFENLATVPF